MNRWDFVPEDLLCTIYCYYHLVPEFHFVTVAVCVLFCGRSSDERMSLLIMILMIMMLWERNGAASISGLVGRLVARRIRAHSIPTLLIIMLHARKRWRRWGGPVSAGYCTRATITAIIQ